MNTLLGITVVVVWITFSVTVLKRAYRARSPSADPKPMANKCAA